jgi:hypothetical protein
MPPKRSRSTSKSSTSSFKKLKPSKDPFKNDEIEKYNTKMEILHNAGNNQEMERL